MQIEWLRTLLAVVDQEGFTAAAQALHRSQSRVSAHVAAVERELGATLLDRTQRPVALTDAGGVFVTHARAVLERLEAASSDVAAVQGLVRGSVALGSYPSASASFVPQVLRRFTERYPEIGVSLVERPPIQLERALADRDVDLVLRPAYPSPIVPTLRSHFLWREMLKAVVHPDHQLAGHDGPVALAEIVRHPLITAGEGIPGETTFYEAHRALIRAGLVADVTFRSNQPQTVLALVREGLGVGIINELAIAVCGADGLRVLPLDDPKAVRDVAVFWDGNVHRSAAADALYECILTTPIPDGTTRLEN